MVNARRQYFGQVDATMEEIDALSDHFVSLDLFNNLIGPEKSDGAQVVFGVKGAGKTALGRVAAKRFKGIAWMRSGESTEFRFTVPQDLPRSGLVKNSLRVYLLEQLIEHLVREGMVTRSDFDKVTKSLKTIGMKILKSTKIEAPFLTFDPNRFFEIDNQNSLDEPWKDVCNLLRSSLDRQRCLVVLDDIDDYFVGIEKEARFIESLCRAVIDINKEMHPTISYVLLMKQGIWRTMFSRPEEYDKIKFVIEPLRWDMNHCAAVLAGRIGEIHKTKFKAAVTFDEVQPLLALEFAGKESEIKACFEVVFSYSTNGPRDVIDLCNLVKKKFPSSKITRDHIQDCLPMYSEEKLNGLNADYGHLYPEIPKFLQRVFTGASPRMRGDVLAKAILTQGMLTAAVSQESFTKQDWYKYESEGAMVKILFDIGVVGLVRTGQQTVFSNEDDSFSQNTLLQSELQVHPAFMPALGLSG